jgi:Tfp pilus assembly PilM family ATPase
MAEPSSTRQRWPGLNLSFGRNARGRALTAVTALEIDGGVLRAAQASLKGSELVVTRTAVAQLNFPPEANRADAAVLGKAVAEALDRLRLKPGQAVIGVPRHSVVLRTLTLPAFDDIRELASVVHMQIGKDLPFRQEEAVIDFTVRPESVEAPGAAAANAAGKEASEPASPPKSAVMVAAAQRETISFYEQVAANAGIKLAGLGWLSQGNARGLKACELGQGPEAVALVSLRADEVAIDIVAHGALLFSRGSQMSAQAPATETTAEKGVSAQTAAPPRIGRNLAEAAAVEVVRSLHSYGGLGGGAPVSKLVVTGTTGHEQALIKLLRGKSSLPAQWLDPGEALSLPKSAREDAAAALSAMGLALGALDPDGPPFDFLNPKRPAVQRNMQRIWTLAGAAAGVLLLIALLGIRSHLVKQRDKVRVQIQAELKKAESNVPLYRKMQQQAATLQNWAKDERNWLEHYAYLSAVLPGSEDLYITSLSVSGQGNIHLAVQARSGEILARLDRQLRAAGYDVKPLAITPGSEKHGYNFRSTVELIVPPKMKIDLSKAQPPARPEDDGSLDAKAPRKGGRS